jgi:hypothetical protein
MTFTDAEQRFLARQTRGHLATISPDGIPQVSHLAREIIRIYPRRVISFNVDPARPGFAAREVKPADDTEVA